MAYSLSFMVRLGSSMTGKTLRAQLKTTAGANQGGVVTTGFVELGGGEYLWTGSIPDDFHGCVVFADNGTGAYYTSATINPEEAEYVKLIKDAVAAGLTIATDGLGAGAVSAAAGAKIADIVHRRTMANVKASAFGDTASKNSVYGFVQQGQKSSVSGSTLTVLNPDGSTLGTFSLTVSAGADPISGIA